MPANFVFIKNGYYSNKYCLFFVVNVIVSTIFGLYQNFIKVLPDLFSDDLDCHNSNFAPCHILKGWGI